MASIFTPLQGSQFVDLVEVDLGGFPGLSSTSTDPQMILKLLDSQQNYSSTGGVYLFYFQARVLGGVIRNPRLYLDRGEGFSERGSDTVSLEKIGPDLWRGKFVSTTPIKLVRFDPSEANVRYVPIRMDVEKLGHSLLSLRYAQICSFLKKIRWFQREATSEDEDLDRTYYQYDITLNRLNDSHYLEKHDGKATSFHNSLDPNIYKLHYYREISVANGGRDPSYAPPAAHKVRVMPGDPKVIAFYLPQFHTFDENDQWWGKGFTEWTNVSKAVPQFDSHYQPRLPGALGYYDLSGVATMPKQFELAKAYGIDAFCYHYYYFDGKRLLEKPIDLMLANKDPEFEFPFCLCWANENWTRRWDGAEEDVLMAQNHSPTDFKKVFEDLRKYLSDARYLKIDGKPVIVVYRPNIIPEVDVMVSLWRAAAIEAGFNGLYLIATTAFGFSNAEEIGFDGICQFPPHAVAVGSINAELHLLNEAYAGLVYPYKDTVDAYINVLSETSLSHANKPYFPGVMMGWDNEARKPGRGHVFHEATPGQYYRWLSYAIDWTKKHNSGSEQLVFINAWNEWAEGTYLEPDRRFGYAYLSATAAARTNFQPKNVDLKQIADDIELSKVRSSDTVVIAHIFYPDLIEVMARHLRTAKESSFFDIIVSVPDTWRSEDLKSLVTAFDPVRIVVSTNNGRDIWPFLQSLRVAADLGYTYGCKVHSKKSMHMSDGNAWRDSLISGLLNNHGFAQSNLAFNANAKCGMVAPEQAYISLGDADAIRDNSTMMEYLNDKFGLKADDLVDFVAGTMFWFRFEALEKIVHAEFTANDFGPEIGAIDGTLAHAFERLLAAIVRNAGFSVERYGSEQGKMPAQV